MEYLEAVDTTHPEFSDLYDEVALWSAPFGLMLLERVPVRDGGTILDLGAGTSCTTVELAQRWGSKAKVIAVDPWRAGMRQLRRKHRATLDSITEMLTQAGFEPLDVATDSFQMRFADGSSLLRHYFIRLAFLPAWKSIVPDDAVESMFAMLERKLNALASEHGQLVLTIPMACVEARKLGTSTWLTRGKSVHHRSGCEGVISVEPA